MSLRMKRSGLGATVALAGLLAGAPLAAHAQMTVGGATFPATLSAGGQTLQLNGAGVRVFFHVVNGYATALYMAQPAHSAEAIINAPNPKVIYTEYLHDAPTSQVRSEYNDIHDEYCADNPCQGPDEASYKEFVSHLEPVKSGGVQEILITDQGVTVTRNNNPVVTINNPSFGKDLIRSLVGSASPTAAYRTGIIGK